MFLLYNVWTKKKRNDIPNTGWKKRRLELIHTCIGNKYFVNI